MLDYGIARCNGEYRDIQCRLRSSCARYLQLDFRDPMTRVCDMLRVYWVRAECVQVANVCDYFIEVE